MTRAEIISNASGFESLKKEWNEVAQDSPAATPFQSWDWQSLWWKHYGRGKRPKVLVIREGKDLIGVAPFALCAAPWTTLRWSGGGPSDYLQPIARTDQAQRVANEVAGFLERVPNLDLIDLHQVRNNQPILDEFPFDRKIDQATCLVLDLPGSFEAYLATLGKSLRYDVRKLTKSLFTDGRAEMRSVGLDRLSEGFEIFLEQHRARWRQRKLPGAFVGRSLRFHREWVHTAAKKGWLRLKVLRVDGQPVGAIYAMQWNKTLFYYQAGFDPVHKAISPGTLLVADSIRTGIEEGMTHFDFMRGDEPYKRRWKPQHEFHNFRLMRARSSFAGNSGIKWNEYAAGLESKIRAKLEGGGAG